MQKVYQIAEAKGRRVWQEFLVQQGQQLLPFVELIADARLAVDEFIDVRGRASLEAVWQLSATTVAGPPHQGRNLSNWAWPVAGRTCSSRRRISRTERQLWRMV